jgi:hypothetical protein
MDWRRIVLTEHMTEAAALVGECVVVLDFGSERASYEIKIYEALKGDGDEPYFALGRNREQADAFQPFGSATTAEEALQRCLNAAGVYHRRRVKQADG